MEAYVDDCEYLGRYGEAYKDFWAAQACMKNSLGGCEEVRGMRWDGRVILYRAMSSFCKVS